MILLKRIIWTIISILWVAFIFFNSTRNAGQSSEASGFVVNSVNYLLSIVNISIKADTLSFLIRKGAHFFEYFMLAIFSYNALKTFYICKTKKILYNKVNIFTYLVVLVICFLVASTDEFIQGFIPGRSRAGLDVMIDVLGSLMALAIVALINIKKIKSTLNNA